MKTALGSKQVRRTKAKYIRLSSIPTALPSIAHPSKAYTIYPSTINPLVLPTRPHPPVKATCQGRGLYSPQYLWSTVSCTPHHPTALQLPLLQLQRPLGRQKNRTRAHPSIAFDGGWWAVGGGHSTIRAASMAAPNRSSDPSEV